MIIYIYICTVCVLCFLLQLSSEPHPLAAVGFLQALTG